MRIVKIPNPGVPARRLTICEALSMQLTNAARERLALNVPWDEMRKEVMLDFHYQLGDWADLDVPPFGDLNHDSYDVRIGRPSRESEAPYESMTTVTVAVRSAIDRLAALVEHRHDRPA